MRNEAKSENELRITLRCRAANVHHASSGKSRPVCVPLAPRATVLDTLRPKHIETGLQQTPYMVEAQICNRNFHTTSVHLTKILDLTTMLLITHDIGAPIGAPHLTTTRKSSMPF